MRGCEATVCIGSRRCCMTERGIVLSWLLREENEDEDEANTPDIELDSERLLGIYD